MTLNKIVTEIWNNLGAPSDLDPDSDISNGGSPMLWHVANLAQQRIASYKTLRGRIFRLNNLTGEMYFKSTIIEGTLDAVGTTTTIVFPTADVGSGDDRYNGWIVKKGSEYKLIVDYDTSTHTATVHEAFNTVPTSGDTYGLYKKFNLLLDSDHDWVDEHITLPSESDRWRSEGNLLEVIKISDLDDERNLKKATRGKNFVGIHTSTGDPTRWYRFGNKLYFNYAPEEEKWFKLEYYRLPTKMELSTYEPEIPEQFQYAIILWGTEWGYRREGESNEKYSTKRDFQEFMEQTISGMDVEDEREFTGGTLNLNRRG